MANYLLAFKGGASPEDFDTPEDAQKVMEAWGAWFEGLGEAVVQMGAPLGASNAIATDGSVGEATAGLSGYTVIAADSLSAATSMAKSCPIFGNGGSIDVYETVDM